MGWLNKMEKAKAWDLEPQPERDIISVEEAMELLPMSKRMIYERVRQGELPAFHIGRRVLMRKSEIEKWLRGREQ